MNTERSLFSVLLLTLLVAVRTVEAAEAPPDPLPEAAEAGAAEVAGTLVGDGAAAALDGFGLDESIFTEIEPFTVPATPIALPEDQREE